MTLAVGLLATISLGAQETSQGKSVTWTLQECLDYALENNIQLQQKKNNYLSGMEDTYQAKADFGPTVSASTVQQITYSPFVDQNQAKYNGSYGVNADMTLFDASLITSLKQKKVQNRIDSLSVETSAKDIRISIIEAYMRCLYSKEAVAVCESTVELSQAQYDRAYEMWKAGSVSKVDVAQLQSQVYSDQYQLTSSVASYAEYKLQLKQLLEFDIQDEIELTGTDADEDEVLRLIPNKEEVYAMALETMPEIQSSNLAIEAAQLSERQAKNGYYPTLGLSAGIGTNTMSGTGNNFTNQLRDNLSTNAGVTLRIPITSARKNKTNVNKARLTLANSQLDKISAEKSLLKEVESAYLETLASQSKYVAAKEQEKYAQESYDLTCEQFNLGMKNTVELISAKNELLQAQQSLLQAKYTALYNLSVLDIYQGRI